MENHNTKSVHNLWAQSDLFKSFINGKRAFQSSTTTIERYVPFHLADGLSLDNLSLRALILIHGTRLHCLRTGLSLGRDSTVNVFRQILHTQPVPPDNYQLSGSLHFSLIVLIWLMPATITRRHPIWSAPFMMPIRVATAICLTVLLFWLLHRFGQLRNLPIIARSATFRTHRSLA